MNPASMDTTQPEVESSPPQSPGADDTPQPPAVEVTNLQFGYDGREVLSGVNMRLERGSRCLLVGANGAGKSTLLRILAGKHLTPDGTVAVLGRNAFRDTALNFLRAHMDSEWGQRTVAFAGYGCALQADIPVSGMMTKLQEEFPERRETLLRLLAIDPSWRMHRVSDGQRRRIQLFLGLLRPFELLLMDEITTCLDVVCRQDLLQFLKEETEARGATVVYATHIFDGLDDWPSTMVYLNAQGRIGYNGAPDGLEAYRELRQRGHASPLLRVVETWLREELAEAARLGRETGTARFEEEAGEVAKIEKSGLNQDSLWVGKGRMYNYWG